MIVITSDTATIAMGGGLLVVLLVAYLTWKPKNSYLTRKKMWEKYSEQ